MTILYLTLGVLNLLLLPFAVVGVTAVYASWLCYREFK
jgi:uncharacterized protein involved in cysteine biosynthesis